MPVAWPAKALSSDGVLRKRVYIEERDRRGITEAEGGVTLGYFQGREENENY
ncbi:MAG: hypothetical protein ACYTF1_00715 [Planctomycetota bacterium]|jgi:hypothetical protein